MATRKKQLHKRNSVFVLSLVLFLGASGGTVLALMNNSREAKRRYETLIAADAAGGDVEGALNNLREYIYGHMNTKIGNPNGVYPPIQLSGTYDRLVAAENARKQSSNQGLYDEAKAHCESRHGAGQIQQRAECVSEYVSARGVVSQSIPEGLYKFDFLSPWWSPDLAGFLLVASVLLGLNLLFQILLEYRLRSHIRQLS